MFSVHNNVKLAHEGNYKDCFDLCPWYEGTNLKKLLLSTSYQAL